MAIISRGKQAARPLQISPRREIGSLAREAGVSEGCLRVHLQLAFLAPPMQAAMLDGTQPAGLSLHRLARPEMPAGWSAQARAGMSRG